MFGRMTVTPVLEVKDRTIENAVAELVKTAENVTVARWIQFPASVLVFLIEPDERDSGAVYVLNHQNGTWYSVDFEDTNFGGYSLADFEELLEDCKFLRLVERPGLLCADLSWVVQPGKEPEAVG
jgi:hypothetical protein